MKKNTPELWDEVWSGAHTVEEDRFSFLEEKASIRWARIESHIVKNFGSFKNLKIIEIGAGSGTHAALMARAGADVTVLDYSPKAVDRARSFFKRNNISGTAIQADALDLSKDLIEKFDVSMSFGLAEHFLGADRRKIVKAHFDVLRANGLALISVPNAYNPPYRIYKFIAETVGVWSVGEEYPFSRAELVSMCRDIGVGEYSFFGDSLVSSFEFINPMRVVRKVLRLKKTSPDPSKIRSERGTFLDQYFSYALILAGKKNPKSNS